ncbi:DUF3040 domain-containing protein [Streptomyces megasporus]|uniref:DUF3040 domain-containing protein n=1 Tax=Streptomyces megasporus TaxID=44060 RepID=UPI0004E1A531|nr:DUF3040 domain-containing protein [Streptomyces megasporus]
MNESRLTPRELRILHETERALREDAEFAARFREFGEPVPGPPPDAPPARRRPWVLFGVCVVLVPALMILHPAIGALLLVSVLVMGTASWLDRRGDRPDRHRGP